MKETVATVAIGSSAIEAEEVFVDAASLSGVMGPSTVPPVQPQLVQPAVRNVPGARAGLGGFATLPDFATLLQALIESTQSLNDVPPGQTASSLAHTTNGATELVLVESDQTTKAVNEVAVAQTDLLPLDTLSLLVSSAPTLPSSTPSHDAQGVGHEIKAAIANARIASAESDVLVSGTKGAALVQVIHDQLVQLSKLPALPEGDTNKLRALLQGTSEISTAKGATASTTVAPLVTTTAATLATTTAATTLATTADLTLPLDAGASYLHASDKSNAIEAHDLVRPSLSGRALGKVDNDLDAMLPVSNDTLLTLPVSVGAPSIRDAQAQSTVEHVLPQVAAAIVDALSELGEGGMTSQITLHLDPPQFGKIEVSVQRNASGVEVTLRADSPQTATLLSNMGSELQRTLSSYDPAAFVQVLPANPFGNGQQRQSQPDTDDDDAEDTQRTNEINSLKSVPFAARLASALGVLSVVGRV